MDQIVEESWLWQGSDLIIYIYIMINIFRFPSKYRDLSETSLDLSPKMCKTKSMQNQQLFVPAS